MQSYLLNTTIDTLTACEKWRGENLLNGKAYYKHDEYYNDDNWPNGSLKVLLHSLNNMPYLYGGIRKACDQFSYSQN